MKDKLTTILSAHAELPSRHSVALLTEAITACRPSRGRNDTAPIGGIATHPRGYGIIRDSHKECDDGDWLVVTTIGPPETDDERNAIAMSMARKWDESLSAVSMGGPDDDRTADDHESRRQKYVRLRRTLVDEGLLS